MENEVQDCKQSNDVRTCTCATCAQWRIVFAGILYKRPQRGAVAVKPVSFSTKGA